jgi:hypothetical protein
MAETPTRILQKTVVGTETTTPKLTVIRELLLSRIPTTDVTAVNIDGWLQAPPLDKEKEDKEGTSKKSDSLCEGRASALATLLRPLSVTGIPQPKEFKSKAITTLAVQWAGVDKLLGELTPVMIKGLDTFVGGATSVFNKGHSFHVVLFLAYGKDDGEDGKDFYVGYDPDISATVATNDAWKIAAKGDMNGIIKSMVLGTGVGGLGPLCRKYYVDKTTVFPVLKRPGFF